jgi:tripeptidyl-peptidase-1
MRPLVLWVLAIGSLVAGALSQANYVVLERRAVDPVTWVKTRRVEAHRNLTIRIGLAQQNLHDLEEALMSVANPDSPTYGQHWSSKRVAEYFAPSEATVKKVKRWLIDNGFQPNRIHISRSKGWISVTASVSDLEILLKAEYNVYTHSSGREKISPCRTRSVPSTYLASDLLVIGCESYSVPGDIYDHVDLIRAAVHHVHDNPAVLEHSDTTLGKVSSRRSPIAVDAKVTADASLVNCDRFTTPQCLRALYSIDHKPKVPHLNSFGVGVSSFVKFTCFS